MGFDGAFIKQRQYLILMLQMVGSEEASLNASRLAIAREHARPSIDVLFESAADIFEKNLTAVLLTGSSADGAAGAEVVASRGGRVIVQDPASAESPIMPSSALNRVPTARVLALSEIASTLSELTLTSQ